MNQLKRCLPLILLLALFYPVAGYSQFDDELDGGDEPVALKVRGKKVVVHIGLDPIKVGETYIALDDDDRRRGALRIIKVGRRKALGKIIKGKVQKGWYLEKFKRKKRKPRRKRRGRDRYRDRDEEREERFDREPPEEEEDEFDREREEEPEDDFQRKKPNTNMVGLLVGTSSNKMTVEIPVGDSTTTADMSGSTSEFHIFTTYHIKERLSVLGTIGQQNFEVAGEVTDNSCTDSNICTVKISYLVATALLRYQFDPWLNRKVTPWIAGGLGLLKPNSAESTAVDPTSIGTTSVFIGGAGVDWKVAREWSVQGQARYTQFFPSDGISSNVISLLIGVGYHY